MLLDGTSTAVRRAPPWGEGSIDPLRLYLRIRRALGGSGRFRRLERIKKEAAVFAPLSQRFAPALSPHSEERIEEGAKDYRLQYLLKC